MAELYYNQLDDSARSKIQFVVVNDDGAVNDFGRLESAARYPQYCQKTQANCKTLPAVQDDGESTLMNALSNGNNFPKDDMALVDKMGNMIQYFTSAQSNMGDKDNNRVRNAVMEIVRDDYKNPCAKPAGGAGEGGNNSSGGKKSPLDELRAFCKLSKDKCVACKGKLRKTGECTLKKKLKCKLMRSEETCKMAKCTYKPPKGKKKMKCKGKGIF